MNKEIERLKNHIIICGAGSTGTSAIQEMQATRTPFVVIDASEDRIKTIAGGDIAGPFPYVVGDVSADHILLEAGISKARGLIAALPDDRDNLFVVLSARQLNPQLRIVSRGIEANIKDKLLRAGADSVISSNIIGGMRMASAILRPHVIEFLDLMLRDTEEYPRIEEVQLGAGSNLAGKTFGNADIRSQADVLIMAAKKSSGEYVHNPSPEFPLEQGTVLIAVGSVDEIHKLRKICHAPA